MKKLILANLAVALLVSSCGNPHVKGSGVDRFTRNQGATDGASEGGATDGETAEGAGAGATTGGATAGGATTGGATTGGATTGGATTGGATTGGATTGGATTGGATTGGSTPGCTHGSVTGPGLQTFTLYVGGKHDAHEGIHTTNFSREVNFPCANFIDFNSQKPGNYESLNIVNDHPVEFFVRSERINPPNVRTSINTIFRSSNYKFRVENPVTQDRTSGRDSGIDTTDANKLRSKIGTIWKFSRPISYWGATLVDVESSPQTKAILRTFDCGFNLIKAMPFIYGPKENGNREIHFVGFNSNRANICAVSLTVGDFPAPDVVTDGARQAIAIDDFIYGY